MLARKRTEDFSLLLRIPPKPAAIVDADTAWRKAVAAREAGQARHIEATRQLRSQVPGQPPTITMHEVDELGAALAPLFEAERESSEARATLRADYEAATNVALTDAIEKLRDALGDTVNAFEELLAHGMALHTAAVTAGVKLPSHLPDRCRAMNTLVAQARSNLRIR